VSFDLTITASGGGASKRIAQRYYAPASVLATGTWYKIGVVTQGVYKLTYQNLKEMGIKVDAINPQNIRLFGNGGGMLPFANSVNRYDDVQENAIYVQGENDGKFDNADYILFYGQNQARWKYNNTDNHYHHQ